MKYTELHTVGYSAVLCVLLWATGCDTNRNVDERDSKKPDVRPTVPPSSDAKTNTGKQVDLPQVPWVAKPHDAWPQIVLTNHATFEGHTPLFGASSFLVRTHSGDVYAATAKHLIGDAGGVKPTISVTSLDKVLSSWRMFPRTLDDEVVSAKKVVGAKALDAESLDWLLFSIDDLDSLPAEPLTVRPSPIRVGEKVYLVGCPYSESDCKQNIYTGKVTERMFGNMFRYTLDPPVELPGFSGAPILDAKGYVVGIMTVAFDAKVKDGKWVEGGGEDIADVLPTLGYKD